MWGNVVKCGEMSGKCREIREAGAGGAGGEAGEAGEAGEMVGEWVKCGGNVGNVRECGGNDVECGGMWWNVVECGGIVVVMYIRRGCVGHLLQHECWDDRRGR
jgi:hypothetical protein